MSFVPHGHTPAESPFALELGVQGLIPVPKVTKAIGKDMGGQTRTCFPQDLSAGETISRGAV